MAQPIQSINLVAPAFKGVNTEDSPIAQDPSFAEIADNAVIDKRGRIASRKGNLVTTTDKTELGFDRIHKLHWFYDDSGNEKLFSMGNNKIMSGDVTLADETPAAYTINDNNWKAVNFNNAAYFFQRNHEPLIYTNAGGLETFSSYNGTALPNQFKCHEALAAYGRLWIAGNSTENQVIYWSDLLIGTDYSGGSSGSIDVSKAWPDGYDEIRALAAHNNLLIIFGNHSILVYQNASSPASMSLVDTVAGVGCVCRNSVQHIGTDILFLSNSGLKSFGRTIQEKSMPLSDLSGNIKTEFINIIEISTEPTASVYSPENSFYLITFYSENVTYCFDLKGRLENGAYRVTRWPTNTFSCFERKPDGTLLTGSINGVGKYTGYSDNNASYRFKYYSPGLTFGDPSKLKILKKLRPTVVGAGFIPIVLKWGYDLDSNYKSSTFLVANQENAFYNVSEFNVAEFTGGEITSRRVVNTTGNGSIVTIGLEADINGSQLSLQEINVQALIGKTL